MKKIVSYILVFIFSMNILSFSNIYAYNEKNSYTKEIIISKWELNKSVKWKKYIRTIDWLVDWLKNNYSKLKTVKNNLEKININEINNNEIKNTLIYLYSKVNVAILALEESKTAEIFESNITVEDKEIVNSEVLKLQNNISESSNDFIDRVVWEFKKANNIKETGDFNIKWSFNQEELWDLDFDFWFNNYEAKNYNFDSSIKWNISTNIKWNMDWEDINFKLETILDMVSKDWEIYIMLKELDLISDEDLEYYEEYIDKLQELAKENKYIKYSDEDSQELMNILNNLEIDNIKNDIKKYLNKPMLEAYKKSWNKYYVKPSKYACDTLKELSNKFDPFNWKECSDSQYKDLLKDLSENWEFYIIIEDSATSIWFEGKSDDFVYNKWEISFNNSRILKLNYYYKDSYWDVSLDYISNEKLNLEIKEEYSKWTLTFNSELDDKNNFSNIDFNFSADKNYAKLKLENKKIEWSFYFIQKWYNYDTWEYEEKYIFSWKINWNTNYDNKISNLNIDFSNKEIKSSKENLSWNIYIDNKNLSLGVIYKDDYSNFILESNANLDNQFMLNNMNLKSSLEIIKWSYDYDTWEYIYDEDFSKVYDFDLNIVNKKIESKLNIFWEENQKNVVITTNGDYSKNHLKLNNNISLSEKISDNLDFSSQLEKARDSVRISDIMALRSAIEQYYQDNAEYPSSLEDFNKWIKNIYLYSVPSDPRWNIEINWCKFGYYYEVWTDQNGIKNQTYKLSTCFESESMNQKAKNDFWKDLNKYEVGIIRDSYDNWFYINSITKWETISIEEKNNKINANFNIDFYKTDSLNKLSVLFEIIKWNSKMLNIEIENNSKTIENTEKIKEPSNFIDYKEAFWIKESDYYNDYYYDDYYYDY